MGKNQDPDPGSGMNIPDHISERLETIFWVKILKFFNEDPGIFLSLDPVPPWLSSLSHSSLCTRMSAM